MNSLIIENVLLSPPTKSARFNLLFYTKINVKKLTLKKYTLLNIINYIQTFN